MRTRLLQRLMRRLRKPATTALLLMLVLPALQAKTAVACVSPVSLPAIESAMARPDLDPAVLRDARDLRARAAKAIEEGRASEGNQLYQQLMTLLGLQRSTGKWRC